MTTKQWLNRYRKATLRIRMYRLQIEELETIAEGGAINIKATPYGKNRNYDPVQESAVKIADLETKIIQLEQEQQEILVEITNAINQVEDKRQHTILTLRYIKGKRWPIIFDEIAEELDIDSERTMFRIHGEALKNIRSVSKCH